MCCKYVAIIILWITVLVWCFVRVQRLHIIFKSIEVNPLRLRSLRPHTSLRDCRNVDIMTSITPTRLNNPEICWSGELQVDDQSGPCPSFECHKGQRPSCIVLDVYGR